MDAMGNLKTSARLVISLYMAPVLLAAVVLTAVFTLRGVELPAGSSAQALTPVLLAGAVAFLLTLANSVLLHKQLLNPLRLIVSQLYRLASGKTSDTPIDPALIKRGDELGDAARALAAASAYFKEKVHWYEALLDSIPFPISVTDMDMNWTFINKPVEMLLKTRRQDVMGKSCNHWGAHICNTENCGIARLRKNFLQTFFDQFGGNYQVDTSYILNSRGEKVGHIEVVQEITDKVSVAHYQENAVKQLSECLEKMAQGDLEFDVVELPEASQHTVQTREKMMQVTQSLKSAQEMLRGAIHSVIQDAGQVNAASAQLASSASQAGLATSQIATTIQQVAKGAAQQSDTVTQTHAILEQVSQTISGVAKGAADQTQAIESATSAARKITSKDGVSAKVEMSAQKVQEMGQRSEQIGAIVETIEDIASQTNLLALNAAIEAARAGEHGKGFAVVADEVRKLAERASTSTKEIGQLVKAIQKTVGEAVLMSTTASGDIKSASEELIRAIEKVSRVIEENNLAVTQLSEGSNQMLQSMENIASISEQNSAAVEEVSASAEEMSAQVEEVTQSTQSLAGMAHSLQEAAACFNVSAQLQPVTPAALPKKPAAVRR